MSVVSGGERVRNVDRYVSNVGGMIYHDEHDFTVHCALARIQSH